tara:strand:+ start:29 stop:274 length:246 start_codon:yes stop_codon:yes gene_type:complete
MAFKMRGWSPFHQNEEITAFPVQPGESAEYADYVKNNRARLDDVQDRITNIESADFSKDSDDKNLAALRAEEARLMEIINK